MQSGNVGGPGGNKPVHFGEAPPVQQGQEKPKLKSALKNPSSAKKNLHVRFADEKQQPSVSSSSSRDKLFMSMSGGTINKTGENVLPKKSFINSVMSFVNKVIGKIKASIREGSAIDSLRRGKGIEKGAKLLKEKTDYDGELFDDLMKMYVNYKITNDESVLLSDIHPFFDHAAGLTNSVKVSLLEELIKVYTDEALTHIEDAMSQTDFIEKVSVLKRKQKSGISYNDKKEFVMALKNRVNKYAKELDKSNESKEEIEVSHLPVAYLALLEKKGFGAHEIIQQLQGSIDFVTDE